MAELVIFTWREGRYRYSSLALKGHCDQAMRSKVHLLNS